MGKDNIYNQLKKLLEESGGKYNILEEQINVELQVEFFELVNKVMKTKSEADKVFENENKLYDDEINEDEKKTLLAELSILEDAKAYGIIKKFLDSKPDKLYQWAVLSLQHSRISLETHLLDEQQVFISTGLGGKDDKLRYFIVCKFKENTELTDLQKRVIHTEFEMSFNSSNSTIEKLSFFDSYFSVLGLMPLDVSIKEVVKSAIHESNIYGDFIHDMFLVTNVKILKNKEIENHFKKMGI